MCYSGKKEWKNNIQHYLTVKTEFRLLVYVKHFIYFLAVSRCLLYYYSNSRSWMSEAVAPKLLKMYINLKTGEIYRVKKKHVIIL